MKLSTRTRYGLRAMMELAAGFGDGPVQIKVIASRQAISVKYLEQLISVLKSGGFVHSMRGAKGGYMLSKKPEDIRLSEIFAVLEGDVITTDCVKDTKVCSRSCDCVARDIWVEVQQAIDGILGSVTLQDMVDRFNSRRKVDYQI